MSIQPDLSGTPNGRATSGSPAVTDWSRLDHPKTNRPTTRQRLKGSEVIHVQLNVNVVHMSE